MEPHADLPAREGPGSRITPADIIKELALIAYAPDPSEYVEIGPDGVSRLRPEVWADENRMGAVRAIELSPQGVRVELHNRAAALEALQRIQMASNPPAGITQVEGAER